jgi:hypothetical protein
LLGDARTEWPSPRVSGPSGPFATGDRLDESVADRAGFEPTSPALMAAYLSELGRAARAALSSGRPCDGEALLRLVARIGGDGA